MSSLITGDEEKAGQLLTEIADQPPRARLAMVMSMFHIIRQLERERLRGTALMPHPKRKIPFFREIRDIVDAAGVVSRVRRTDSGEAFTKALDALDTALRALDDAKVGPLAKTR